MCIKIEGKNKNAVLIVATLSASGLRREALEIDARSPGRLKLQEELRQFKGKLPWEGILDEMRADH